LIYQPNEKASCPAHSTRIIFSLFWEGVKSIRKRAKFDKEREKFCREREKERERERMRERERETEKFREDFNCSGVFWIC